jgi:6-phosphogluconolactonase
VELNVKPDVRVFPDVNELSLRAAEATVRTINDAVRSTGRCSLVLSGGSTPRTLYGLLASPFREQIPWAHVHVFWGDERYVPHGDAHSNYRMAKKTLLDHVPCPVANVHPMPTHFSAPDAAARDYEATLGSYFSGEPPAFDLVLLGLGPEGHTVSLFPESPALAEPTRWVLAVTVPADPPLRLTLTFPALNRAANAYFLVTGSNKAPVLHHILTGTADPRVFPAAGVRPGSGTLIWWVDRDAAAQPVDPDLHKGSGCRS